MEDKIYSILMDQDDITWQSLILDLIKQEQMDPWDISISKLTRSYITVVKKMKENNLRIPGKVLLAAAILLRIKSSRLIGEDMAEFDRMFVRDSGEEDMLYDEDYEQQHEVGMKFNIDGEEIRLIPRTPQPRKRKVSVYDLLDALEIALNVKRRRMLNTIPKRRMEIPEKSVDITRVMDNIFEEISEFFRINPSEKLTFEDICPSDRKLDKVRTFIPLLHLSNARKVDLKQKVHFGEILVMLAKKFEFAPEELKAVLEE